MTFSVSFSQVADPILIIAGTVRDNYGKKLSGVKISIKKDNQHLKSENTSAGKYDVIEIPFGFIYLITFEKDGYVSKSVLIDAKNGYFIEDQGDSQIPLDMTIFPKEDKIDYSIVNNQPVGKLRIFEDGLGLDNVYNDQRKSEIDKFFKQIENEAKQKEIKFNDLVSNGNKSFSKNDFATAINKYEEALKIKSDNIVSSQLETAKKNLDLANAQKEQEKQYDSFISSGDQSLKTSDFQSALEQYNKAKELIPANQTAYDKIKNLEKLKQAVKEQEIAKEFNAKMDEAKSSFESKDYSKAISLYNEAAKIDPRSKSPKERIDEINSLLATQKSNEEEYQMLVEKADDQFSQNSFDDAISNYKRALKIKPNEAELKDKISKVELAIKEALEKSETEKKFQNLVKNADLQLKNLEYEQAKSTYQKALALKNDDTYSKEKINYIDVKLKEIIDTKNQEEKILKDYQEAIAKADKLFSEDKFQEAISAYEGAKKIKENESYPDQKINDINIKLAHIANQIKEKNQKFKDFIIDADKAFKNKNWSQSKTLYEEALAIDNNQEYPQNQIAEIAKKINEEAKMEAEIKQNLENFNNLISQGDQSLKEKNYKFAMDKYISAQQLNPEDVTVKQKINHLNNLIDEQNKSNTIDANYNQLISQADQYRDNDNFNDAIKVYNQAIKLKPLESYPKTQIEFVNDKIKNLSKDKIRSEYEELIKNADILFNDKSYNDALQKYDEANEILPNEPYPIDKIREIKKLLIEKESKDNQYQRYINQADNEFESGKWEKALNNYQLAINIYNKEHPINRIEEIKKRLSELKSINDAASSEKNKFDDIIIQADQLFSQEKYVESKVKYQEALNLFKDEYYPKKKLAEIELILREIEVSNALIEKYNNLISRADALKLENKFDEAKILYQKALDLNPSMPEALDKITQINQLIKDKNKVKLKEEFDLIFKKAENYFSSKDYQKAREFYKKAKSFETINSVEFSNGAVSRKIIEINQIINDEYTSKLNDQKQKSNSEKYNQLIQKAEDLKSKNHFLKAKELFLKAKNILPDENLAREKIIELDNLILEKLNNESKAKYDNFISKADQFFSENNYDKAINYYQKALVTLPDETLPKQKIKEVSKAKIDAQNQLEKQNKYNLFIKQGNRYFESKNYSMAILSFQNASKADPEKQLPKDKVVEINKILDENPNNSLSNNQSILNSYSLLYGQEVTGKYNESQIEEIMGEDNEYTIEMDNLNSEFKKDIQQQFKLKNQEQQEFQSNNHLKQINIFYQNVQKSFENSDDNRWNNIPKVTNYKLMTSASNKELSLISLEKTMRNYDKIEKKNTDFENKEIVRAEIIAKNDLVTDNFFDEKFQLEMDRINRAIAVTYSNSMSNEAINYQMELDNSLRSNKVDMWAVGIDNYKQEASILMENQEGHYVNITYNNHISSENMLTLFNETNSNLDEPRIGKIIPSFGYYENDYFNKKFSNGINNVINTYNQFENNELVISKLNDFVLNADDSRKENANKVDHYIDKEISKNSILNEVNTDKVYNLHFLNNMYQDDIDLANQGKEDNRVNNVFDLESYNDNFYSSMDNSNKFDMELDYFNAQQIESAKSVKVNQNSAKNIQKLAQLFPEGVTEKVYERKDSNGDVSEVTIIRIVVIGNKGDEYKKVRSKWGINYFKNGVAISQQIWDTDTN